MKKVYVDTFGTGKGAAEMRSQMVRRLKGSGRLEIVNNSKQADAVIRGDGQTWTIGYVSLSPHSPSARSPVYQGFLSVKVLGKNDDALWSFMVTPS